MAKNETATDKAAERKAALAAKRAEERDARAGETKADSFKRIAKRRTNNALDAIAGLRGLSNKANYEYEEAHHTAIIAALRAGVDKVEADFRNGGPARNDSSFSL